MIPKTKAGYAYPVNCVFDIYNDDDFANTFIIRTDFTIRDAKMNYCYYIITRADFSIDSISSSTINLGFTLEMLKKYVINMNDLIINLKGELNNHNMDEDEEKKYTEKELAKMHKKKLELNIIEIKFRQNEPLGYCFVLNEEEKIIKDDPKKEEKINKINKNQLVHYNKNLLLYDVTKFNYIRSRMLNIEEEADEDISESVDINQENNNNKSAELNNNKFERKSQNEKCKAFQKK